jgi:hypothetical protein
VWECGWTGKKQAQVRVLVLKPIAGRILAVVGHKPEVVEKRITVAQSVIDTGCSTVTALEGTLDEGKASTRSSVTQMHLQIGPRTKSAGSERIHILNLRD